MSPAMAAVVGELLGASTNRSSASSKLVEDVVDAAVDGGKLKQSDRGPLLPTLRAGEGDREPLPRPLPEPGS